jgi:tetratricopeptide (TPR) repeat protein
MGRTATLRRLPVLVVLGPALLASCSSRHPASTEGTLAELRGVRPDLEEAEVQGGLEQAMEGYRRFLAETPETAMTPEAMRRLADLQLEKQFGIRTGDGKPREMAAPEPAPVAASQPISPALPSPVATVESEEEFERRTTAASAPAASVADPSGPLEAIALYDRLLAEYPSYAGSDQVLYQKARAYDELGRTEEAMETMDRLLQASPHSVHRDEVQFRRGEYFFTRRRFRDAEKAYGAITAEGTASSYYELALYKLGWTFYKQELYEEALHEYMALLDYKVSIGYDFDEAHAEEDERRVADTYRVISLSFTNLGGPEAVPQYFARFGPRGYEDRVYANLGQHYLDKLRYDDAAKTFKGFVALYPFHRAAPRFSMRVVETFTQGGFPKLVLEARKEFASRYGLKAEYWQHFSPEESPEVLAYLKADLKDLANHYHAQYQDKEKGEDKLANYREALRWYGDYLDSFPADPDSPPIAYQMADLLLEHGDFGLAAKQYERTAYGFAAHPQAAAAGYAAVYAYREQLKVTGDDAKEAVRRDTVQSSLRFADTFPQHEQAAGVLGAAADDLYEMKDYAPAVVAAQRVLDEHPEAEGTIRRSAWVVVAHGSFEVADYARAEQAYAEVLAATSEEDEARAGLVDNLAASIYKQGEQARDAQNDRGAAAHFLRIRTVAPTSTIRAAAEYDAGAALIRLQDWKAAAEVLEAFRAAYPDHELRRDATREIAHAYREDGQTARAAGEYERLAAESEDPGVRAEALLLAGELHEKSGARAQALDVYGRYVTEFPRPLETALETRSKMAALHQAAGDDGRYRQELQEIVRLDAEAGPDRTDRTRTLAARGALVLAEDLYRACVAVKLRQPFETSLQEKKQRMDEAIEALSRLPDYEIADVTAAATYYMGETYLDFSRALAGSERPADLEAEDLAQYELSLEEEAFPFEEKAIDLHQKNLELLQAGVFNPWTDKSLGKLVELVPGRYARSEISSGFLGAIDSYQYRSPLAQLTAPAAPAGGETPVVDDANRQ